MGLSGSPSSSLKAVCLRFAVLRVSQANRLVVVSTRWAVFASGGIPEAILAVVHGFLELQDEVPSVPPEVVAFLPAGSRGMLFLHPRVWTSQAL